jgi:hypothetical protein
MTLLVTYAIRLSHFFLSHVSVTEFNIIQWGVETRFVYNGKYITINKSNRSYDS